MCGRCLDKGILGGEGESDEVQIWSALATFDDDAKPSFFKNKEDAIVYIMNELKKILEDEDSYDHDGDLRTPVLNFGLRAQKLRN